MTGKGGKHTILERLEEAVQCSICHEKFKDPRALPCLHTFCLDCLKKCITSSRFDCMLCRKPTVVPSTGPEGFEKAHHLTGFIDVFDTKEVIGETGITNEMCQEHVQIYKYFCETCSKLICTGCLESEHLNHTKQVLQEYVRKQQESISQFQQTIGHWTDEYAKTIDKNEQRISDLNVKKESCIKSLRDHIEKRISKLKEVGAEIETDINDAADIALNEYMSVQTGLRAQQSDFATFLGEITATLKGESVSQLTRFAMDQSPELEESLSRLKPFSSLQEYELQIQLCDTEETKESIALLQSYWARERIDCTEESVYTENKVETEGDISPKTSATESTNTSNELVNLEPGEIEEKCTEISDTGSIGKEHDSPQELKVDVQKLQPNRATLSRKSHSRSESNLDMHHKKSPKSTKTGIGIDERKHSKSRSSKRPHSESRSHSNERHHKMPSNSFKDSKRRYNYSRRSSYKYATTATDLDVDLDIDMNWNNTVHLPQNNMGKP